MSPSAVLTREEILAVYAQGPEAVVALITALCAQLARATATDSHNSGRPPSTDVTRCGRTPKSLRRRSGRRPGGQPGHRGATLAPRELPDAVILHAPPACDACGHVFAVDAPPGVALPAERRQVFDLPPLHLVCTEHQVTERPCPHCGAVTRGRFPGEARTVVQYGPGVLAAGVALTAQHLLPVQRAADVLAALTGQRISPATLLAAERRIVDVLAPVLAHIRAGLAGSPVLHFDETGFFVATERHWLHVACTPTLTLYTAHPKRGTAAHDAIGLLPTYAGTAVHDGYASYPTYRGCQHALCGVHLLRELTYLAEEDRAPATRRWAAAFRRTLETMRRATVAARRGAGESRRKHAAALSSPVRRAAGAGGGRRAAAHAGAPPGPAAAQPWGPVALPTPQGSGRGAALPGRPRGAVRQLGGGAGPAHDEGRAEGLRRLPHAGGRRGVLCAAELSGHGAEAGRRRAHRAARRLGWRAVSSRGAHCSGEHRGMRA